MEQIPEKESVFISGIDSTITEADLKEFFATVIKSDCNIIIHHFTALNKLRAIGEVILTIDDSILAHQQLNNTKLKNCYIKLLPKSTMKSLIITNLPDIISEKDLFLLLNKMTVGLKRITIADDPEVCGKTSNIAVISYQSYELARKALETLRVQNKILGKAILAVWKEPHCDILSELAMESRVIYIKNISASTSAEKIKGILSPFGNIVKLKRFVNKAFIEFDSIAASKKAIEQCNEKRFDGLVWKVFPSKRFDEEKAKENPDKNSIFSKNFLEEEDQQVLLKFAFDGTLPDISPQVIHTAHKIVEAAKKFQVTTISELKKNYDNLVLTKNTITSSPTTHSNNSSIPTNTPPVSTKESTEISPRKSYKPHYESPNKPSRTQDKYFNKQKYREQKQYNASIPRNIQDPMNQMVMNPHIDRPPVEVNMVYQGGAQYDPYQRPVVPIEYTGTPYFVGQQYMMGGGQWNPMVPQQLNPAGNNFMNQPQLIQMNPGNMNRGYINPQGAPSKPGGGGGGHHHHHMGKGYRGGYHSKY